MADFHTLDDIEVRGKRVLLRADLNVPVKDGKVTDATRIERLAPTIRELAEKGARVIVMSHFGRPEKGPDPKLSLKPLAEPLAKAVGRPVAFAEDCIGAKAQSVVDRLKDGEIALLENTRFYPEEEKNDPAFAKSLAALGDLYVNDAFSAAHRAHASTDGVARLLPAAAGRLMQQELEALHAALGAPKRPVAAIVAGAKVSTKLQLLDFMLKKVQVLVIGGAMANTLLLAQGKKVGRSLVEKNMLDAAQKILSDARSASCELILPVDAVVAPELKAGVATQTVAIDRVPDDQMILDIGPQSVAAIAQRLEQCPTLVWNGPVGAFETKPFDAGTVALAQRVAALTRAGKMLSVAGGGDTVAALHEAGVIDQLTYVSTAGGAFLEWLEGRDLPGVSVLKQRN
ncbi:MAG TPA: phosphoglycerate kinase [Stellaceae bacterium]|jgi:phosphoglycerate kinase|nr:phosphoglycerate kinase [Stellaceae bacterium]